jgi:cation diffusion facilitator family transporter
MTMQGFSSSTHDHVFLGDDHLRNERKLWLVIALTASMMGLEIGAGAIFGSMALVADGWHMSTHAAAMLISALAYYYARRHAHDRRFTFGTGKLGDLAGFASAIVLALVALSIGYQSLQRFFEPVAIGFDEAIAVAVLGLVVNLVSARLLSAEHAHHLHAQEDRHDHSRHDHDHRGGSGSGGDNNLRAAYVHVLADALTSVLAIVALLLGRFQGWLWADPLIGVIGALAIAHWSRGLIQDTGAVLLDFTANDDLVNEIRDSLENEEVRITDLHVWRIAPRHHAAIVALEVSAPERASFYKSRIGHIHELSHVTLEIQCEAHRANAGG